MDGPDSRQSRQDVLAAEDATMTTTAKRKIRKATDTDRGPKDPAEYGIAWAKTLYTASLLLAELLLLAFRLLICSLESLYNLLLPPVEKSLANEIVLVTGTGHGIGRELCFQFAPHGCTVVCCDIDEKGNEETVRLLAKLGYTKNIHAYTCDVSNRAAVLAMAEKVRQEVGDVTVLVNNAGIMPCHPLSGHKPQEIEKIFDVNVLAHFWTLEAFLPSMVAKNHGHVVALSSMCGVMGIPNVVPYCASKFAVRGLMEALYEEMRASDNTTRKSQIKFTTVYPIMVGTGLVKRPRNRFPALLALLPPDRVASMIVKAMRRNYKELSLPPPMLFVDRVSRLLPSKFIQHCKDFLDTGVDPVD